MHSEGIIKLNETNYYTWSLIMKALLVRKDLWDVVDGSESRPTGSTNSKAVRAYEKKLQQAHAEIILNIEPDQHPHVRDGNTPQIWESLRMVHTTRGFASRLSICRHLLTMKKGDSQTMQTWIVAVKHIAYHLNEMSVPPDTVLDDQLKAWMKAQAEEDLILVLTAGLGEEYEKLVVTLDATPCDQLTLDYVIAQLLNEELRQTSPDRIPIPGVTIEVQALATKGRNDRRSPNVVCHNCNGRGHYKSNCPSPPMDNTSAAIVDGAGDELGGDGDSSAF
jgi:gag-polypeptide of LTR copia-type/Domain of unknown function (DUF4219)/Zinc knuckle